MTDSASVKLTIRVTCIVHLNFFNGSVENAECIVWCCPAACGLGLVSGYALTLQMLSDKRLGRIAPDLPESNEHRNFSPDSLAFADSGRRLWPSNPDKIHLRISDGGRRTKWRG